MKIVIDTNVMISAMFFGGKPRKLIDLLIKGRVAAYANGPILSEYREASEDFARKYHKPVSIPLPKIIGKLCCIDTETEVHVCRDPDDDKFIGCAVDSGSKYIVSGDKDLLAVEKYGDVEIVTVADFLQDCFPDECGI